jgi:DUF1707 SHOCT-like domain/2TM domain
MCHARRHHDHAARSPATQQDPGLRASDADREEAVTLLREHAASGRLDVEELEQRVSAAYVARTHGELAVLQRDLPRAQRAYRRPAHRTHAHDWSVFLQVNALLVAIWAVSGAGYFWPAWVIAWWGFALVLKTAPRVLRLR